jgi:hypothetical protein
MKKIFLFLAAAVLAGCSGSDDSPKVELYLTADGVQRPFFADATTDVNADGASAVLVYADRNDTEQITFDVLVNATGDNVVKHVAFIPDSANGTVFEPTDVFYSTVSLNNATRIKGSFSGNVTDGQHEQYIACTFDIKKTAN